MVKYTLIFAVVEKGVYFNFSAKISSFDIATNEFN